jgi:GntR family transcriptional regulator, transcriptional repressor for pyruvate dehydrogenase complex
MIDRVQQRRSKVSDQVIEDLQAAIVSRKFEPGSKLPSERDLASDLGVSQPTVREAVRALTTLGLIDVRHGSGVYVSSNPRASISNVLSLLVQLERVRVVDVLETRQALATYSIRRAVGHATDEEIDRLIELAARIPEEETAQGLATATLEFQGAVAAAAHHPLLFAIECFVLELLMKLQFEVYRDRSAAFWRKRMMMMSDDRMRILQALKDRDADKATKMMETYLGQLTERWAKEPNLSKVTLSEPGTMRTLSRDDFRIPDIDVPDS